MLTHQGNQEAFSTWWNCVWTFGGISDYLRAVFIIILLLVFARGLLGVILSTFKPSSATTYIFIGGLAGAALLVALWSGILNGSGGMAFKSAFLGAKLPELSKDLVSGSPHPISDLPFLSNLLKLGWQKLALIGCAIWIVGTAPFSPWWRRLK